MLMKALTVWQPWATLVAIGAKAHEFRGHNRVPRAAIGARIAIHAGQKIVPREEIGELIVRLENDDPTTGLIKDLALPYLQAIWNKPELIVRGAVVATAVLGKPVKAYDVPEYASHFVNDSDRDEHANYAWPLTEVIQLQPPIEAKGAQGFWNWESGN
jgi:hypothetical protein